MLGNIIGGIIGAIGAGNANSSAEKIAAQNIALQREFATHGIRWKVEDARQAGVHPLYALGASTTSFSPVSVGYQNELAPLADAAKSMGQDITRSAQATRTAPERIVAGLQIERAQLENDILRSELASKQARLTQGQVGPAFPDVSSGFVMPGQGDAKFVTRDPLNVTPAAPSQAQSEPSAITDVGYARTATGWAPVPSKDVKERIEDQIIPELMWSLRNNVLPSIGQNVSPPPFPAPAGQRWEYHWPTQEYRLIPVRANMPTSFKEKLQRWYDHVSGR